MDSMEHLRNIQQACSSEHEALVQQRSDKLASTTEPSGSVLRGQIHSQQLYRGIDTYDEIVWYSRDSDFN